MLLLLSVLIDLHWLPVYYRVVFKMLLLSYKSLNGLAPIYKCLIFELPFFLMLYVLFLINCYSAA